jgi:hypothetical protein
MIEPSGRDVAAIIREGTAIDQAIEAARGRVVRRHQQLGIPLVIWDGARVVEVPPEAVAASEEQPRDGESGYG